MYIHAIDFCLESYDDDDYSNWTSIKKLLLFQAIIYIYILVWKSIMDLIHIIRIARLHDNEPFWLIILFRCVFLEISEFLISLKIEKQW